MIQELMNEYSKTILVMFLADAIVFVAMAVDLVSGLNKAKQRGEIRSSWGLKRTLRKVITYEGGMIIMHGIDALMHASHIVQLFHLDVLDGVPFFTCMIGVFLLVVELLSVKESADQKTQTEMTRGVDVLGKLVNKDMLKDAISEAIAEAMKGKKE